MGWESCAGQGDTMHHDGRLLSYSWCHYGEENKGQRAWVSQRIGENHLVFQLLACNIDDWIQGLDEEVSDRERGRTHNIHATGYKPGISHAWHVLVGVAEGVGDRECLDVPRCSSRSSPSLGDGSSDGERNQSSLHSTMMRASSGSDRSVCTGRGLWVKVNLPIFKDEKSKDAVTLMVMGCGHFSLLWLGWSAFAT